MSVNETNVVDGLAVANEGETLVLLITDHLPWDDEQGHIKALQSKINAYISFWRSGQYEKISSASGVKFCSVEIRMKYEPTEEAIKFLENANKNLLMFDMGIIVHIDEQK